MNGLLRCTGLAVDHGTQTKSDLFTAQKNRSGGVQIDHFAQRERGVPAVLRRFKQDGVTRPHCVREGRVLPIELYFSQRGVFAVNHFVFPVKLKYQTFTGAPHHLVVPPAVHEKYIQHRKAVAAEQLGSRAVEQNRKAVADQIQRGGNGNSQWRCKLGSRQRRVGLGQVSGKISSAQRDAGRGKLQKLRHTGTQARQLAAAAHQKHGARRFAVRF